MLLFNRDITRLGISLTIDPDFNVLSCLTRVEYDGPMMSGGIAIVVLDKNVKILKAKSRPMFSEFNSVSDMVDLAYQILAEFRGAYILGGWDDLNEKERIFIGTVIAAARGELIKVVRGGEEAYEEHIRDGDAVVRAMRKNNEFDFSPIEEAEAKREAEMEYYVEKGKEIVQRSANLLRQIKQKELLQNTNNTGCLVFILLPVVSILSIIFGIKLL